MTANPNPAPATPDLTAYGKSADLLPLTATNYETPPAMLTDFVTPVPRFFVRSNYPFPDYTRENWQLSVSGSVARELTFTLRDLLSLPPRTLTAWMECYGNSRSLFVPGAVGNPWTGGAVGNATWTGVPLSAVLDRAGVREGAVEVLCQGGDDPEFRRSLPLDKARDADTLLAWEMNGEPLARVHGFPVRLVVPGWGGIASVKWITGLTLLDAPFEGHYQTNLYVLRDAEGNPGTKVSTQPVKSLITSLRPGDRLRAGRHAVSGVAWSGGGGIAAVEASTDGGATWQPASITEQAGQYSWARWSYDWEATPGDHILTSRATDAAGAVQPEHARWNLNGYQYNGWHRYPVVVSP